MADKKCPNCGAVGKTKFAHDIAEEVCQGGSRRYCNLPVKLMPEWRRMKEETCKNADMEITGRCEGPRAMLYMIRGDARRALGRRR